MIKRGFVDGWYSTATYCDFVAIKANEVICSICIDEVWGTAHQITVANLDFDPSKKPELDRALVTYIGLRMCNFNGNDSNQVPQHLVFRFDSDTSEWDELFEIK